MRHSRSGIHLQLKMVISTALLLGLRIIVVSRLVKRLIALCGCFGVAMYRRARNLEHAMVHGATAVIPICHSDKLQIRCRASL